jgi:transposase-like protein
MVRKFLSREDVKISHFSKENGIPESNLRYWIRAYQNGNINNMETNKLPKNWKDEEKYQALISYMKLEETDKGKWLRTKGLKQEHIDLWEKELLKSLKKPRVNNADRKKIKALEKDLRKKEKALAEVTALLALKKKVSLLFGEEEED